jgi:hypothetical protein
MIDETWRRCAGVPTQLSAQSGGVVGPRPQHLTDEETAERLAALDRLTDAIHRERASRETVGQAILGLIGSGVLALLTVLAFVVL